MKVKTFSMGFMETVKPEKASKTRIINVCFMIVTFATCIFHEVCKLISWLHKCFLIVYQKQDDWKEREAKENNVMLEMKTKLAQT